MTTIRLCLIEKKAEGPGVPPKPRPISLFEPIHNAGRALEAKLVRSTMAEANPLDVGFGAKDGALACKERIVRKMEAKEDDILMMGDLRNAYHHVYLDAMLAGVRREPNLAGMERPLIATYAMPSTCVFYYEDGTEGRFWRTRGGSMGDPLLPHAFMSATLPILRDAREEFPDVLC